MEDVSICSAQDVNTSSVGSALDLTLDIDMRKQVLYVHSDMQQSKE
jgi:hypothetical protein